MYTRFYSFIGLIFENVSANFEFSRKNCLGFKYGIKLEVLNGLREQLA